MEIGRGGFGVVYRATETDLRRNVAVKMLRSGLDERGRDRFDRERQAMGSLSGHPNIVTVYRTGFTDDNRAYIVMEFLERGSMDDHLRRSGPVDWREAARIGIDMAGALESAHRAGVLHRDIKPGNIVMSGSGQAKLGDFGIARIAGSPETTSSTVTASVAHAAPEVIDGHRPTAAADVYSLASTLYELTVGRAPFTNPADETMVAMLARIARDPLPPHPSIPPGMFAVLTTATAKDPGARHASADAFGTSLQAALEADGRTPTPGPVVVETATFASPAAGGAEPAAAASSATPEPAPAVQPVATGPTTTGGTAPASSGGPNGKLIGALAAAVLAVVAIVFFATRGGDDSGPPPDPTSQEALEPTAEAVQQPTAVQEQPTTAEQATVAPDPTSPPPDPTATAVQPTPVPTASPAGFPQIRADDYEAYRQVTDLSGAISVDVPEAWSEMDFLAGFTTPTLAVSPNLVSALNTFDTPGVFVIVTPGPLVNAAAALDPFTNVECLIGPDLGYEDPAYTGVIRTNTECGASNSTIWLVAASPPENDFFITVGIQGLGDRDESAARRILDSFFVDRGQL
ncbi:MAG: serine/threonine-protein kinase [Actinomycetota bacterium]